MDPEDEEHKETIKYARKKLDTLFGSGYSLQDGDKKAFFGATGNCSEWRHSLTQENQVCLYCGSLRITRKRVESTLPRNHDDHIAEKRFNSLIHYNLVEQLIPMLQAMLIPDAKAAVKKE